MKPQNVRLPPLVPWFVLFLATGGAGSHAADPAHGFLITETGAEIRIQGAAVDAAIRKKGYVCFIHEFGERPVRAGESFSAAFIVGFFDSIEEMERVYDEHKGHSGLDVDGKAWRLR